MTQCPRAYRSQGTEIKKLGLGWDCDCCIFFHSLSTNALVFRGSLQVSAQSGALLHDVPLPRIFLLSSAPGLTGPAEREERSRGSGRGDRGFPGDAAPPPRTPGSAPTSSALDSRDRDEVRGQFLRRGAQTRAWNHAPSRRVQSVEGGAAHPAGWRQNRGRGVGRWSGRIRSRDS